jgi:hypothetical protein
MIDKSLLTARMTAVLFVMAYLLASCGIFEMPSESGAVLFQDDFSRPISGWDRYEDEIYYSDYSEGVYRIAVFSPNTDAWANPRLDFGDIRINVDAFKNDGPDDNIFGIICRYQDPRNFYFFLISSDGYTGIGISKDGRRVLASGDSMLPSTAVNQGNAVNHIRAECIGYDLRLYVNDTLVAQAYAAEWQRGDVGLIAGTYAESGTDIYFDNFSVVNP